MADRGRQLQPQEGGFWSSPQANYSKETQNLLKEMMKESKLTNFQQRELQSKMKTGQSLPTKCGPTFTEKTKEPVVVKAPSKKINPKTYSGGIRSKDTIEDSGAYERPEYNPPVKPGYSKREKERLTYIMQYGHDLPPIDKSKLGKKKKEQEEKTQEEKERFDEILAEIDERRAFMDQMERLGQADKHRQVVDTEISQLIREMEVIDKKKSAELERAIADQKAQS
ncbi:UPF0193 protein EVG1 homolog [Lineus longissimus]|uniref:UPF0193 protein EVG1 homolog n=1 Tax=Lineus longissimus TaxID=88925 RepID=UPI002B4C4BCF